MEQPESYLVMYKIHCFNAVVYSILIIIKIVLLWNSQGISVHAFEFSYAENLSAQHMG